MKTVFNFLLDAFILPNLDSLSLGDRIMAYLPLCNGTYVEVRKVVIQVCLECRRFALPNIIYSVQCAIFWVFWLHCGTYMAHTERRLRDCFSNDFDCAA